MKITLNTEHCGSGIQKASNITPSKSGTAYLKTMWLRACKKTNTVSFMTTDASTEYIGTYPAEVIEEGLVGVQSRAITDLIRSLPPGLVHLETDEQGNNLIITQGKRLYKLCTSAASWFQEFSPFPEGDSIVWSGEIFSDIIEKILFCIADDEDSSFSCLCIRPNNQGGIDFCGLDGNKFALCTLVNDNILEKLPEDGIKVQKKYISDIKKLISSDDIEMTMNEKRFFIRDKEKREMFSVPLINMNFIDYSIFLNKTNRDDCSRLNVNKEEFVQALSRNSIFNSKDTIDVRLTIQDDSLTLESSDKTTGSAVETIPATCSSSIPKIAFVTKSLIEILQHVPGSEVEIKMASAEGPCSFQAVNENNYTIIAMPIQLESKAYYEEDDI